MYTPKGKTKQTEENTMTGIYQMRETFELKEYNTAITRADFEAHFTKTAESVQFTFNGWDGKSYDGESRKARVYRTSIKGYENVRFIKVGKALCYIDEESLILEKATGESHPEAEWLVDVLKAAK
ncbi:MAG: hypothetical protein EOM40_04660 [Clostridia bacterium]|jgi:hypothetical protein|nr:hypothetical protein [Clostridia bacterium]